MRQRQPFCSTLYIYIKLYCTKILFDFFLYINRSQNDLGPRIKTVYTFIQSITAMREYENKSFEELRFEDYQVNRKFPIIHPTTSTTTSFGFPFSLPSATPFCKIHSFLF